MIFPFQRSKRRKKCRNLLRSPSNTCVSFQKEIIRRNKSGETNLSCKFWYLLFLFLRGGGLIAILPMDS